MVLCVVTPGGRVRDHQIVSRDTTVNIVPSHFTTKILYAFLMPLSVCDNPKRMASKIQVGAVTKCFCDLTVAVTVGCKQRGTTRRMSVNTQARSSPVLTLPYFVTLTAKPRIFRQH
jgi:hypothetical protein